MAKSMPPVDDGEAPKGQRRVGAYAKLLANYASDDAIIEAGESAELLFVRGLAFLATADSDGFITDAQVVRYVGAGMRDAAKRAQRLVKVGVWERVEGGYHVRSWLKIHESAVEKGRKRKADRERKARQAADSANDSARIPRGIQTEGVSESLLCSYVSREGDTEQSITSQDSAPIPAQAPRADLALIDGRTTTQGLIGEWIDHCAKRPPGQVVGQVAKSIDRMLAEGVDPQDVRRGLAAWHAKGLSASVLPSVVNEVMNAAPLPRSQRETDDLFERAAKRLGVVQ